MRFSRHFERDRSHRPDRQGITIEMCERVVAEPIQSLLQENGRTAYWGPVPELSTPEKKRYLQVVVLPDGETLWTAHLDRNFRKRVERGEKFMSESEQSEER